MADIHILPGVLRTDLERRLPVERVWESVRESGVEEVVVLGRGVDGEVQVWGTDPDVDKAIALCVRGMRILSAGPQVPLDDTG